MLYLIDSAEAFMKSFFRQVNGLIGIDMKVVLLTSLDISILLKIQITDTINNQLSPFHITRIRASHGNNVDKVMVERH